MKIDVTGGEKYSLNLTAENKDENVVLLKLAIELNEKGTTKVKQVASEKPTRKPYKKQRATRCPDCGQRVKGSIGLGLHRAKSPTCKGAHGNHHDKVQCQHCDKQYSPGAGLAIHMAKIHPEVSIREGLLENRHAEVKPKTNFLGENFGKLKSEVIV